MGMRFNGCYDNRANHYDCEYGGMCDKCFCASCDYDCIICQVYQIKPNSEDCKKIRSDENDKLAPKFF